MHTIRRILAQSALVIGAVLVSASIQTFAFTDTSATPPNNDAYAPLTTSDTAESKVAGLTLNIGGADVGLVVNGAVRLNNAATLTCGGPDGVGAGAIRYNAGALELCDGSTWGSVGGLGFGVAPIGTVMAWHKSMAGTPSLPSGWVECNGQTLNDAASPYNGRAIPNLNGSNQFLRGASASGGSGGASTHFHSLTNTFTPALDLATVPMRAGELGSSNHLPPYFDVVWIMRVK